MLDVRQKPATVLIVDDSPEDRGTYRAYLREQKDYRFTFVEADDAETGLQLCRDVRLDCVLLDYQLPDLSGKDFLGRWQQLDESARAPVVMVTGKGSEAVAVECLKLGAMDYIAKANLSEDALFRAIHGALRASYLRNRVAEEQHERAVAELELRESEARFRLLVESVEDYAIVMLDVDGRVSSWNAGARTMFGYHDLEIIGHAWERLFNPEHAASRVPEVELQSAASMRRSVDTRWYIRKDGTRLWASSVLTPVQDPVGGLRGYSWVVRDMSSQRGVLRHLSASLSAHGALLDASRKLLATSNSLLRRIEDGE